MLVNKHLSVSRSEKNKPYKYKKNFLDIINTEKGKYVQRLSNLFKKHPNIDVDLFFRAPYRLYPDVEFFGLDYFSSMRAIKAYTTYKKQVFLQDADSQISEVQRSLDFIAKFCIENKLYLHQYQYHRTADLFTWMKHYKENKINIYSVMEFKDIYSSLRSLSEDLQKFFVGQFVDQFQLIHAKYRSSSALKPYIKKTLPKLSIFIENQLTSSNRNVL